MSAVREQSAGLLTPPAAIVGTPAAELTRGAGVGCIDGRSPCRAIGAPGGSAGELALLLAVGEWLRGVAYRAAEVARIAAVFADRLGGLYLHTDTAALAALATHLGVAGPVDLCHPAPALREPLLAALIEPQHVGCGHFKAMLTEPGVYRVRPALVGMVLQTVHRLAWERDDVIIDVLEGEHTEAALAVFHTRSPVSPQTLLPSVRGPYRPRFFIEHIAGLRHLRRRAGALLRAVDPQLAGSDPMLLSLEVERLGERQLSLTAARLAPDLPRYRVTFDADRRLALEFNGE
jgi:hypothetical protein